MVRAILEDHVSVPNSDIIREAVTGLASALSILKRSLAIRWRNHQQKGQ